MRYFDGLITWLGLLSTLWTPEPTLKGFGPRSIAWTVPTRRTSGGKDNMILKSSEKSSQSTKAKRIPVAEQIRLVGILVAMQKKAEENKGLIHTLEEELEVDEIYEGDIVLTIEQAEEFLQDLSHHRRKKRKLDRYLNKRWTPPIPYTFDGSHSATERSKIRQALNYWEELTCITFREDAKAEHKLYFVRGPGCWSFVGFTRQVNQSISIGPGCQSNGTIAHEVGHAVGFWHEQSRPDRDDYINIHTHNVRNNKLYNFESRTWGEIVSMDIPYDLGSDMHYGAKFYASDPNSTLTTVETKDPLMTRVIGQRQTLSFYDVKLANKAYCEGLCATYNIRLQQPCRRDGYQDPKNCRKCRCPDGFGGDWCEQVAPSVNAYCGGTLTAHTTPGWIYSPGYPNPGYTADVQCSWLIKAPPNNRVYFEFVGDFGIAGHDDVCRDFVEIRYNSSLSLTGARFCCTDPPKHPIVSDTGEMLILFRSYKESRVCDDEKYPWKCKQTYTGFRGKFYYQSCGGCASSYQSVQNACVRTKTYACLQQWTEKVKLDCPRWWYTNSCQERTVNKARYATCSREEFYCCPHYSLDGNICRGPGAAQKRSYNVLPPTPGNPMLSDDDSDHYQTGTAPVSAPPGPPVVRWTPWSDFGECTVTCGGGLRTRQRRCTSPGYCGSSNSQVDNQPCNQSPCVTTCTVQKSIICDMWTRCTRTVQEPCKKCNDGHRLVENVCLPNAA